MLIIAINLLTVHDRPKQWQFDNRKDNDDNNNNNDNENSEETTQTIENKEIDNNVTKNQTNIENETFRC